jgi:hypothetical protein
MNVGNPVGHPFHNGCVGSWPGATGTCEGAIVHIAGTPTDTTPTATRTSTPTHTPDPNSTPPPTRTPGGPSGPIVHIDCDVVSTGIQDECTYAEGTDVTVAVVIENDEHQREVNTLTVDVMAEPQSVLDPLPASSDHLNSNPDLVEDGIVDNAAWGCSFPPTPDRLPADPARALSSLGCIRADGGATEISPFETMDIVYVRYAAAPGTATLSLHTLDMADSILFPVFSCDAHTNPCVVGRPRDRRT